MQLSLDWLEPSYPFPNAGPLPGMLLSAGTLVAAPQGTPSTQHAVGDLYALWSHSCCSVYLGFLPSWDQVGGIDWDVQMMVRGRRGRSDFCAKKLFARVVLRQVSEDKTQLLPSSSL